MGRQSDLLADSVIVAAHPDDELLWFNSILRQVDQVIIVYRDFWARPDLGPARAAAIADYPRGNVDCLEIAESGAAGCANWADPQRTDFGVGFTLEAHRREVTRLTRKSLATVRAFDPARIAATSVRRVYKQNFHAICAALEPRLRAGMNVFTHNPWGEYGHEEHVQVFRALELLRERIGFRLWMSNYCTERALPLAMRHFSTAPGSYVRLPTDKAFADEIADVYRKHGCWTWADDWAWFDEECFMEAPRDETGAAPHRHLFPLNFFTIDAASQRMWLPLAITVTAGSAALAATLVE